MNSRKKIGKWIATLVVITVTGFSAAALAQQGMQHGQMGSGGQGWGSNWQQNMGNMSPADMQKMQQLRDEFLQKTEGLRQDLTNKDMELRNELGKQNPDQAKVTQLQKEMSQLETRFYRVRDEYMLKMQKINPNMGRGMMRPGSGHGMMQPSN